MNQACDTVQDLLPELASGRLQGDAERAVRTHAAGCAECGDLLESLSLLAEAAVPVPPGLETRIQKAVAEAQNGAGAVSTATSPAGRSTRGSGARRSSLARLSTWGWAAAAVLALVVGRGVFLDQGGSTGGEADILDGVVTGSETELVALGEFTGPTVVPEVGMVAGAPVLDGLSDEDLMTLLEEWEG